jgi:hypothetical protein
MIDPIRHFIWGQPTTGAARHLDEEAHEDVGFCISVRLVCKIPRLVRHLGGGARMKIDRMFVFVLGALICGCGGSGPATSTTVNGTIAGAAFTAADAIGSSASGTGSNGAWTNAVATITNFSGACAAYKTKNLPASASQLDLDVVVSGSSVSPGTYQVSGGSPGASVVFNHDMPGQVYAQSGSVTLDTVSTSTINGSFDVTLTNGDHLTGSFVAPICSL